MAQKARGPEGGTKGRNQCQLREERPGMDSVSKTLLSAYHVSGTVLDTGVKETWPLLC